MPCSLAEAASRTLSARRKPTDRRDRWMSDRSANLSSNGAWTDTVPSLGSDSMGTCFDEVLTIKRGVVNIISRQIAAKDRATLAGVTIRSSGGRRFDMRSTLSDIAARRAYQPLRSIASSTTATTSKRERGKSCSIARDGLVTSGKPRVWRRLRSFGAATRSGSTFVLPVGLEPLHHGAARTDHVAGGPASGDRDAYRHTRGIQPRHSGAAPCGR